MTAFTFAYLGRLEIFALAAILLQGGLVLPSWLLWERVTRDASAEVRHRLACAHFAALAVLPALMMAVLHFAVAGMPVAPSGDGASMASRPLTLVESKLAPLAPALAALWLAGFSVAALRLLADLRAIARFPSSLAPAELVATLHQLSAGWVGRPTLQIRAAGVAAPQVVGWRRPVILAPHDLSSRLTPAEREAVLRHELAHVVRRDFAWNLVQRLVLAVLWFQPAAWVLYADLGREREMRCDSLAVRHGAAATDLARALVRLAESRTGMSLALGSGGRGDLRARVIRLLDLAQPRPSPRHLRVAAPLSSALCLAVLGAGPLAATDPALRDLYVASAFGPTLSIRAHDPAGSFRLRVRQGRVVEASLGAQPLPQAYIRQSGERVTLSGAGREPPFTLRVTPQGRIQWEARS